MKPTVTTLLKKKKKNALYKCILPGLQIPHNFSLSLITFHYSIQLTYLLCLLIVFPHEGRDVCLFCSLIPGIWKALNEYYLNEYSLFPGKVIKVFDNPF